MESLTRRSLQLLQVLFKEGTPTNIHSLQIKQSELAEHLGISRQALNVHLRKLRLLNYIRTGRGFIDVTEDGMDALGISRDPAFILVKVSPRRRAEVYEKIRELDIHRAFRIAGDVDALVMIDRSRLEATLRELSHIAGVRDTKSYVAIESIKQ